jgi:hypothetical protein
MAKYVYVPPRTLILSLTSNKVPEYLFPTALASCPDGSISVIKAGEAFTRIVTTVISDARTATKCRPLAVYGTHLDILADEDTEATKLGEIDKMVYSSKKHDSTHRTKLCAAGQYVGARNWVHMAGGNIACAKEQNGMLTHTIEWPKTKPTFESLWNNNSEKSVSDAI